MAMLSEEGQFSLDLGPVRRRGAVAKVARSAPSRSPRAREPVPAAAVHRRRHGGHSPPHRGSGVFPGIGAGRVRRGRGSGVRRRQSCSPVSRGQRTGATSVSQAACRARRSRHQPHADRPRCPAGRLTAFQRGQSRRHRTVHPAGARVCNRLLSLPASAGDIGVRLLARRLIALSIRTHPSAGPPARQATPTGLAG